MNMSPSTGREQKGNHYALILSDRQFNGVTGFAFIAPITTMGTASRNNHFAISLSGAGTGITGVVQIDQVRSFDFRARSATRTGDTVPPDLLEDALERFGAIFGLGIRENQGGE